MLGVMVAFPWLAVIPGALLLALGRRSRTKPAALAGLAWLLYAVYESLMKARVLCSGECNIRVDLLLIYPALGVLTVVSIIRALRGRRQQEMDAPR